MAEYEQESPEMDLAGYPDMQSLVQGYRASSEEGKRQRERADALEENNRALLEALTAREQAAAVEMPRQSVPDRRGGYDELSQYVDERVERGVTRALEPIANGLRARQELLVKHPDYLQFEQAVADYIAGDADLASRYPRMFHADPVAAMELAFLRYGASKRAAMPMENGVVDRGRVDAGIPTSRAGDSRGAGGQGDLAVQNAFERFQKTGSSRDARAFAQARLGPLLEAQFRAAGGQSLGPQ